MSRGGAVSILGGIAVTACLMLAPTAGAATLVGDYQFQGTLGSSGPGPALANLGAGNSLVTDNVMGVSRQVLSFPADNGLQMAPAGVPVTGPYSEVVTFRFDSVTPDDYLRVLDSTNGVGDSGLYVHERKLDLYSEAGATDHESASPLFSSGVYATVAMVMAGSAQGTIGYFNGARVAQFLGSFDVTADTLRFFKDNGGEESDGAVSCIRVYSGALTDAEVAAIGASPTCAAPSPAPSVTTTAQPKKKKCKKKKKHRAAEAKKKKCKKKKKY